MTTIKTKILVDHKDMELEVDDLIYMLQNIKHPVTISIYYKEDKS